MYSYVYKNILKCTVVFKKSHQCDKFFVKLIIKTEFNHLCLCFLLSFLLCNLIVDWVVKHVFIFARLLINNLQRTRKQTKNCMKLEVDSNEENELTTPAI